jgi:hypothetical protein
MGAHIDEDVFLFLEVFFFDCSEFSEGFWLLCFFLSFEYFGSLLSDITRIWLYSITSDKDYLFSLEFSWIERFEIFNHPMIDSSRGRSYEHSTSAYEGEHVIDSSLVCDGDDTFVVLLHKKSYFSHLMTIADSRDVRSSRSDYTYTLHLSSSLIEIFYKSPTRPCGS